MTKAATSATVYTIGDIIAQKALAPNWRYRPMRTLHVAGGIGHGPLSHYWYHISDSLFNDVLHWTAWWSFIPKVVLTNQHGALFGITHIFLLQGLMQRRVSRVCLVT
jgi:protein Mpv17